MAGVALEIKSPDGGDDLPTPLFTRAQLDGTSIDPSTLLSADYFNLFNEVIMLLGIFPDLVEDVEAWGFKTYEEHFDESGLPFAHLAVEAYRQAPAAVLADFHETVSYMRAVVEDAQITLRRALDQSDAAAAASLAAGVAEELQLLVATGGLIVNGRQCSMSQSAIDDLF